MCNTVVKDFIIMTHVVSSFRTNRITLVPVQVQIGP